jgi:hypothetical protein
MLESRSMRALLAATLLLLCAGIPALAQQDGGPDEMVPGRKFPPQVKQAPEKEETPWILRWMIKPLRRGMWIRLPIMDTDPNRGITGGLMPIWVIQGEHDDRIRQIHAPSLTYNRTFKMVPTYRYYFYPQEDAALVARGSVSKYESEALGQYEDNSIAGTEHDVNLRLQYNQDAGQRFFGLGPDSSKDAEGNYKERYWQLRWGAGTPVFSGSKLRARFSQHHQSGVILDGPLANLTEFHRLHPAQYSPSAQQVTENRLALDWDTRDSQTTTTRGAELMGFAESSVRGFASMYDYQRYGGMARWFKPWASDESRVFAAQFQFEQLAGAAPPFWLMPRLGGKYSLRAYGEGRYVDRGMAAANIEQRFNIYSAKMAGVTTEFQLAPFVGLGTVYDRPDKASKRYARPVYGLATRAVAKPQVVGSIDFGAGQEGLSVFMDINYSF